ncbi:WD40 repeat-like protein, partial [Favolaschia claudopus]
MSSSIYTLLVRSVDAPRVHQWKHPWLHSKTPNLYIVIFLDGVLVNRTPAKRSLSPKWDYLSNIPSGKILPTSLLSLQLFQHSRLWRKNICLSVSDITVKALSEACLCRPGKTANTVNLELRDLNGTPAGTLMVELSMDNQAAVTALEQVQDLIRDHTTELLTTSAPISSDFEVALGAITEKLELIVHLGDTIAMIHPYANMAWKVLTAVYKACKKQQDINEKLFSLVQTMLHVYSFVEDINPLDKIKAVEEKALAIVRQTVECALFIQEYTQNGFCDQVLRSIANWDDVEQTITNLSSKLIELKGYLDGSLTVQALFLSATVLQTLHDLVREEALRKLSPVDMNASSRPLCLAGTRCQITDDIAEWLTVRQSDDIPKCLAFYPDHGARNILWFTGVAGSGKSTIATTLSESFRHVHRLGAFLFFDRNDSTRSDPNGVIRTMAYLLALSNPHIATEISGVIVRDPAIVNAPIKTQFSKLLLEPLCSVEHLIPGPIIIILDALDECGSRLSRHALLSIISSEFPRLPHFVRILITSRPEADLIDHFQNHFPRMNLDLETSADDVQLFIHHEIAQIGSRKCLGSTWVTQNDISALIKLANGLFIWASTALRFIDGFKPLEKMKTLITGKPTHLNDLYDVALQNAYLLHDESFTRAAHPVLTCLVLAKIPLDAETLDALLGFGTQRADTAEVLKYLGCVVQWGPNNHACILHASFADYITGIHPSKQPWAVNPLIGHCSLAVECLLVLTNQLRFNMCSFTNSHVLNDDVPDLFNKTMIAMKSPLVYASCFWFHHMREAGFDPELLAVLKTFLQTKFLFWLEALSLLDHASSALPALHIALNYVKGKDDDLQRLIEDMTNFVAAFGPVIAQSAPHIYLSALPFAPSTSRVGRIWNPYFPCTVKFESPMGINWPRLQTILYGHHDDVTSVDFSLDGNRIASASKDGTIRIWDAHTAELVTGPIDGNVQCVNSIQFSLDGTKILSGTESSLVQIWDAQSGTLVIEFQDDHLESVRSVCFSPNGKQVVSGSANKTICLWELATCRLVCKLELTHQVQSVNFSSNGKEILVLFKNGGAYMWNPTWNTLSSLQYIQHDGSVLSAQISPDSTLVASGAEDGTICIWSVSSCSLVGGPFRKHTQGVTTLDFAPDGKQIASGSNDGTVCVWDIASGNLVAGPFDVHTDRVRCVHFSPDGSRVASGANDNTVRIWNVQTDVYHPPPYNPAQGHKNWVQSIDFSPDGLQVVSGSKDGGVRLWNSQSSTFEAGPFKGHTDGVTSVHFSPDGSHIASGSSDGTVCVWNTSGKLKCGPLRGHRDHVNSVHFAPDGLNVVSGSDDCTICIWSIHQGKLAAGPFRGHIEGVTCVDFSPDGTRIVSGSRDRTIRIWDSHTGALIAGPLEGHEKLISTIRFFPNGKKVVSGSADNTLRVWDVESGRLIAGPLQGHTDCIRCLHVSFDGRKIVSGSDDQSIRVWSVETGILIAGPIYGHTLQVSWVHFSRDGKQITSGSLDATMRVFQKNHLGDYPQYDTHDGWIQSSTGERLLWVPIWLREGLYLPHNTLITRARGVTRLDLANFVHGTEWQKCIDPEFLET